MKVRCIDNSKQPDFCKLEVGKIYEAEEGACYWIKDEKNPGTSVSYLRKDFEVINE